MGYKNKNAQGRLGAEQKRGVKGRQPNWQKRKLGVWGRG